MTDQRPPERPWFRARRYGWGWTPQTWQGWLAVAGFVGGDVLVWFGLSRAIATPGIRVAAGVAMTFILLAGLVVVCYARGETPHWRWGDSPDR